MKLYRQHRLGDSPRALVNRPTAGAIGQTIATAIRLYVVNGNGDSTLYRPFDTDGYTLVANPPLSMAQTIARGLANRYHCQRIEIDYVVRMRDKMVNRTWYSD